MILFLIYIIGFILAGMLYLVFDPDWIIFTPMLSWVYIIGLGTRIYFDNYEK